MTTVHTPSARVRQPSPQPVVVWLMRQLREQQAAIRDLIVLLILSAITFILLVDLDFTEAFYEFTRRHENLQLDEFLLVSLVVLCLYVPIFALRRWRESVRRLSEASTDSLTGMSNRRRGWQVLEVEGLRAKRYRRPLSISLFDIDKFKEINDRHGHLIGDRILREVARIIQSEMRSTDTLARWGGEEFLIISPETNRAGVRELAERMRRLIERSAFPDAIKVTASFGTAEWQEGDEVEDFYQRVDEALYEAKTGGRNMVV